MLCYCIHIFGSVYKTGLRYYLKQKASECQINGQVFYLHDKSVEVIAAGSIANLYEFLTFCLAGNYDSRIKKVDYIPIPLIQFESFDVVDEEAIIESVINDINHFK